jgi:class 3 adenylate cyclase/tetratricopeptide (TPR) repeat protein
MSACAVCGYKSVEAFKFCPECGAAAATQTSEQRRVVTVLFCDVVGSTALGESADPEAVRATLARYFESMRAIVERHGGTVEKFIGDAVMAVFGVPVAHEDDAMRACRAAVEMQDALPALAVEGRIGVATGEVVTGTKERLATGDAVNLAARLQQAARPGEALVGEGTRALVGAAAELEAVEPLALKGKAEPVSAFRLRAVHEAERPPEAPFVGRERELAAIHGAWKRALSERRCELVTIVGEAGVGKSRLVTEAFASLEARSVQGRCLPYGEGITYWPVVEILKQLGILPLDRAAATAIRSLLGDTSVATSAEEIAWAFRKTLEQAAAERPLIVVFDDIQWGEETFLDLLEHVALLSSGDSILVLAMARPELTERRASWPVTLRVEPLGAKEVEELIPVHISGGLRAKIARVGGGNPLFVEEMVAMAGEAGEEVVVPPTLQALVATRLDQLDPAERRALERAAVEGEVFHRGAVQALAGEETQVTPRLASLVRKGLIRPEKPQLPGEDGFRFRHLLIRDAAYASLPKAARAELHQRFAGWLDDRGTQLVEQREILGSRDHAPEYEEILGYHLEQAHRSRAELGPLDEHAHGVGRRAAECLAAAGRRALARGDAHAATNLLERALAFVPPPDPFGLELARDVTDALILGGNFERADQVTTAAIEAAGDSRHGLVASLMRADIRTFTEPEGSLERLRDVAEHALPELEKARDDNGLERAWAAIGWTHHIAMRFEAAIDAFERAFTHARRAGDERQANQALIQIGIELIYGATPAEEAIKRCNAVLEDASISRWGEMGFMDALAVHEAMLGHFDAARELIERVRAMTEDLGLARGLPFILRAEHAWIVETLAGDAAAAEDEIRAAYEVLERWKMGEKGLLSTQAARLAQSLYAQQRYEEAEHQTRISEQAGASDDMMTQVLWRQVRAKALARRGEDGAAEDLAREAVALAQPTDALDMRADALVDLVEVLRLVGRKDEPKGVLEDALRLYEQKGNVVSAARARDVLANAVQTWQTPPP